MAAFDVDGLLERFARRAKAVKERGIPPLEGDARRAYLTAAQEDFTDYSLIADASWELEETALILRIPLGTDPKP
ncbi:MAG: hypothetical protein V3V29_07465 [Acidimicrobiia bacterium]